MAARKKAFDKVLPTSKSESRSNRYFGHQKNPKGRASVVQCEVLSLYLKILYQVEGMPIVHSGVINKNDNMDEHDDVDDADDVGNAVDFPSQAHFSL